MKKIFTIAVTAFAFHSASGQISAIEVARYPEKMTEYIDTLPYDSLVNFVGPQAQKYVGQTLYMPGKPVTQQILGYQGFVVNYKMVSTDSDDISANLYQAKGADATPYEALANKYFKVTAVFKHPNAPASGPSPYFGKRWLKLVEKASHDTLYYWYDGNNESDFPFITLGYRDKLKKTNTGSPFVFTNSVIARHTDITTGKPLAAVTGEVWKCTDIQTSNTSRKLSCILQNSKGQKMSIGIDSVLGKHPAGVVLTEDEEQQYVSSWRQSAVDSLLQGLIAPGMNSDMVKLAWGEPASIDKKAASPVEISETWLYPDGGSVVLLNYLVKAVTLPGTQKKTSKGN